MNSHRALIWSGAALSVLAIMPTVFRLGPIVEAKINPVLANLEASEIIVRKVLRENPSPVRLLFRLKWEKRRKSCPLLEGSWRWELDSTAFPAIGYYADTGEQYRASTSSPTATRSRQLYTDLPQEIYSYKEAWLVFSLYYPGFCEGIFPTSYVVRIKVELPSAAETAPLPEAEAE